MYYFLCCNISTLSCTSKQLEDEIKQFSEDYLKINDSFWIYFVEKDFASTYFISVCEYLITYILRKYTNESSILFSFEMPNNYYEAPSDIETFLKKHPYN